MEPILKPIYSSPRFPLYVNRLRKKMDREKQLRQSFYDSLNEDSNVEFINGEIVMHSPAKFGHILYCGNLNSLVRLYVNIHHLGVVTQEKSLVSLTRNDYEPDICFFSNEKLSGFDHSQLKFPAPDMIVEVTSSSTAKYDSGIKFDDYSSHGVAEYWIVDPDEKFVEQFFLRNHKYYLNVKIKSGEIESKVINGFKIDVDAIFDSEKNTQEIKRIVSSNRV